MKRFFGVFLLILFMGTAEADLNILMRTGSQFNITTAVDSNGWLYVAYVDSNSPSGSGIYFTYSHDGGRNFEPQEVIDVLDTCDKPDIVVYKDTIFIVYEKQVGSDKNIYLVRGTPGNFSSPITVADSSLKEESPSIAIDTLGYIYIAYICSTATGRRHVFYKVSSNGGLSFGPPVQVTSSTYNNYTPTIRVQGGGGTSKLHVVFADRSPDWNIKYIPVTEAGSATPSVGTALNVAATTAAELIVRGGMAVSPRGDIYVAYDYTTDTLSNNYAVQFRRKAYNGVVFTSALTLVTSSAGRHYPQVESDAENNPIVVWEASNGADQDIILTYSLTQGTNFVSSRITLNRASPATNQRRPDFSIFASTNLRRVFVAWQDWQYASAPDIFGKYLIHFRNGFNPEIALGGYPVGMGAVYAHYNLWGLSDSTDINAHETTFVWIDSLSRCTVDSIAQGSSSTERWIWDEDSSWTIYITSYGNIYNIYYYHQYLRNVFVQTIGGGDPLTSTNSVAAWGTSFGISDTVDWLYDGHPLSFWGDRGSHLFIAALSRGSGINVRWISNPSATHTDIWVVSAGTDTIRYYHQYLCDIILNFTDIDHTVNSDARQFFGIQSRPTNIYERWTGWCDAYTLLSFEDTTTGTPAHWTTDITDWYVREPINAIVNYSRFISGYNFMMTAISTTEIELSWVDYPNEDYYLILNARDTTIVPGTDTIPANTSSYIVSGLSPNTGYYWMIGGFRYPGYPLYYTNALLTYTLTPDPPANGQIIDLGSNFVVMSIPPFPNDMQAASGYYWDCVMGEPFGGVDTFFYDGTTTWLLAGLEPGHTYIYHVYYRNGDGILSDNYATITFQTQEAYTHILSEGMRRGWNMFGVSIDPRPPYPISQFSDDISPFYTSQSNSNIYYYDENRGIYRVPDSLKWGSGYFLFNWYSGTEVDMRGSSMYTTCLKEISYTPGMPYAGWAILGNPYLGDIQWESILYSRNTQRIDNTYYTWTDYGWAFYSPFFAGGTGPYIHPFMGFEVHARPGGGTVEMKYPILPPRRLMRENIEGSYQWAIQLSVLGDDGSLDLHNYIIKSETETENFDILEPPPFIGGFLQLYIEKEKLGYYTATGINYSSLCNIEIPFWVETNVSREVELRWKGIDGIPLNIRLWIEDITTGTKIDLRENSSYRFTLSPDRFIQFDPNNPPVLGQGSRRGFRFIMMEEALSAEDKNVLRQFGIKNIYPNPFNSETRVVFEIPEYTRACINVYDATGHLVRTVARRNLEYGIYEFVFDGRDNLGKELASGVYFVRLETSRGIDTKKVLILR